MSQALTRTEQPSTGVIAAMATRFDMDPRAFEATLRATVVPKECTKEQFAAFLMVAKEYDLNPITKEIYAFPANRGIQPIVSIDGWMKLMNTHPDFDGIEFEDHLTDDGQLLSITAKVFRKNRAHPVAVTEYMAECRRNTEPWTKWPRRMLRHKAAIQAARYAFGFSGIMEPDEVERAPAMQPALMQAIEPPPMQEATRSAPAKAKPAQKSAPAPEPEQADAFSDSEPMRMADEVLAEMENVVSGIEDFGELQIIEADYLSRPELQFPEDRDRAHKIVQAKFRQIRSRENA